MVPLWRKEECIEARRGPVWRASKTVGFAALIRPRSVLAWTLADAKDRPRWDTAEGSEKMLFGRRERPGWNERMRVAMWPRRSFLRSFRYFKARVLRLNGSPHAIAAGVAAGAFASCTPLVGFHFLLAFALAFAIGGSMIAAALGTAVGNPLTFPLIWLTSFEIGETLLGRTPGAASPIQLELSFSTITSSFATIWPTVKPMIVGGALMGAIIGTTLYFVTFSAVKAAHRMRAERLARLAVERQAADGDKSAS